MKKRAGEAARDADCGEVRQGLSRSGVEFAIRDLKAVEYGSKRAEFTVITLGIEMDADLFIPTNGRAAFAIARSVRDKFTGQWRRTTRWPDELAAEICARALMILKERDQS